MFRHAIGTIIRESSQLLT